MNKFLIDILAYHMMKQWNTQNGKLKKISVTEIQTEIFPYQVEVIAERLNVPWAMASDKVGNIYITERGGTIRLIEDGKLYEAPIYTLQAPFQSIGEGGLMGIALDADFETNDYIYVMYTYRQQGHLYNQVVRLIKTDHQLVFDEVLIDQIPAGRTRNGGRIKIGPDKKLYITTGDAENADLAQDLTSLAGKILRINVDGSIPDDNPIVGSAIYSYGHRNPQGLAWDESGVLYASEHGASAHDEINRIIPGGNYGWGSLQGSTTPNAAGIYPPLLDSGDVTWAPAGMTFVNAGPWNGKLLVSNLKGEQLLAVTIDESEEGQIEASASAWLQKEFGRLRDVIRGNGNEIYISTSNRDGRGMPKYQDDRILRLTLRES